MSIPEIIKHYRGSQSLRLFAAELGVSHAAVHLWENGDNEPTDERIAEMVNDKRAWVRDMGRALFMSRNGQTLKTLINERNE